MQRTVLIVEDSQQHASTLEIALQQIPDLAIETVYSGEAAIDFLQGPQGARVCAVLTDLQMPRVDGFELIERVRSNPKTGELPIIVLSGATDPAAPERTYELGANAFFAKPYSPSAVRSKLEQLLDGGDRKT
ncbi:MAG: response regulator [Bryobacteraceae bacterium]